MTITEAVLAVAMVCVVGMDIVLQLIVILAWVLIAGFAVVWIARFIFFILRRIRHA